MDLSLYQRHGKTWPRSDATFFRVITLNIGQDAVLENIVRYRGIGNQSMHDVTVRRALIAYLYATCIWKKAGCIIIR